MLDQGLDIEEEQINEETKEDTKEDNKEDNKKDTITLVASNLDINGNPINFILDKKSALLSNLLKISIETDKDLPRVELGINSEVLEKIVEYLKHHNGNKKNNFKHPLTSNNSDLSKLFSEWDEAFIEDISNSENKTLILELISGANYMDIPSLLELCCIKVAIKIKFKNHKEIDELFGKKIN